MKTTLDMRMDKDSTLSPKNLRAMHGPANRGRAIGAEQMEEQNTPEAVLILILI